jgi:hypothetical protein
MTDMLSVGHPFFLGNNTPADARLKDEFFSRMLRLHGLHRGKYGRET